MPGRAQPFVCRRPQRAALTHGGQRVEVLQAVGGRLGRAVGGLCAGLRGLGARRGRPGRLHGDALTSGARGAPGFPGRSLGGRRGGGGISGARPCASSAARRRAGDNDWAPARRSLQEEQEQLVGVAGGFL